MGKLSPIFYTWDSRHTIKNRTQIQVTPLNVMCCTELCYMYACVTHKLFISENGKLRFYG